MSPSRFRLLLALTALLVAAGGFAVGLAAFDDGGADSPPENGPDDPEVTDAGATDDAADTTTSAPSADVRTDALPSPSFIVVVTSERDEASATSVATAVAADGHPAGVLRSDDYQSLNPGFWVSYTGPYESAGAAADAAADLTSGGRSGVYVRCAGTNADCNPGPGNGEGNGDGDGEGNGDGDD